MNNFLNAARRYWYVIATTCIIAVLVANRNATYQGPNGDPYIYWAVGGKFLAGQPLYVPVPGSQEFLYPPVAAATFCQLMATVPFPVAVAVFTFLNFMLWLGLLWLTSRLLKHYVPTVNLRVALLIGFVATIRYFWHNILWVNVNEIIALLCLGGVYTYLKGRETIGLTLLTVAMWIKVMPLLIIGLFFLRKPRQTVLPVLGTSALLTLLVIGFRGIEQGTQDYLDYWEVTFRPFLLGGKVFIDWIAFGISPTLSKLLTAHGDINGLTYNIVSWPPAVVGKISLAIRLLILGLTYRYVWLTRKQPQLPLLAILLVFLTILLVSGVAWEGHHVTLLPVVAGLYVLLGQANAIRLRRWMVGVAITVGLLTSDLVGTHVADYLQAYSLITYNVLFLFGIAVWLSLRKRQLVDGPLAVAGRSDRQVNVDDDTLSRQTSSSRSE